MPPAWLDMPSPRGDRDEVPALNLTSRSAASLAMFEGGNPDGERHAQGSSSLPPRPSTASADFGSKSASGRSPRRSDKSFNMESPRSAASSPTRHMPTPWSPNRQAGSMESISACPSPMRSPRGMNVLAPGSASPSPRRRLRREAFPEAPPDPSRGIIPFQDLQNAQMLPAPRIAVPTAAPHAAAALELEEACARIEATHISEEACEPAPVEAAVPNDAAGLLSLPVDAVAGVLGFLDADSLASVMCSCTALAVAGADDALWRGLFLARWRWRAPSWAVASATADADSAAREEPE
eukprot:CAMPEP_0182895780 /NCGR_PEP_ID=MMETSP0034_2-20130328/25887_1 /TAXON_ID=156128 /ORGANISM="Nephroselmis pyriformis, Strain CCMP717" /LENGTH=294 /DNA_ID=CAMNT_0025029623 /DNA_START=101 /DNA_END=982 /DNA_ORIENTATION=+